MKSRSFLLFVRAITVAMFSFGAFLPIVGWNTFRGEFSMVYVYKCAIASLVAGFGYGVYRFLQEYNRKFIPSEKKMRYNIKYEHTSFNIEERSTF